MKNIKLKHHRGFLSVVIFFFFATLWSQNSSSNIELHEKYVTSIFTGFKSQLNQNNSQAILHYNNALSLNDSSSIAHYRLGAIYFKESQFEKSKMHFEKALEISPLNNQIKWGLYKTRLALGDFAKPKEFYPLNPQALALTEIEALFHFNRLKEALTLLDKTENLSGTTPKSHSIRTQIYTNLKPDNLETYLISKIKQYPTEPSFVLDLLSLYQKTHQENKTQEILKKKWAPILSQYPDWAQEAYSKNSYFKNSKLASQSNTKSTIQTLKSQYKNQPDNLENGMKLAKAYIEQQSFSLALKTLEETLEWHPSESLLYLEIGKLFMKTNDPLKAEKILLDGMDFAINKTDKMAFYNQLSMVFKKLNNHEKSKWYADNAKN